MPFYKKLLPLNLQFFNDEPPAGDDDPKDPTDDNPDDDPKDEPKQFDEAYVEKLRKEAAKYRTKAKDLESQSKHQQQETVKKVFEALGLEPDPNKEFEKQLSEAQTKAQEAEQRANERLIKAEIKALSSELGIVDANVAFQLMNRDEVQINDEGEVEGAKKALEALLEAKPFLKKENSPSNGGGDFGQGTPPSSLDAQIKEAEEKGDRSLAIALKRQKAFGQK